MSKKNTKHTKNKEKKVYNKSYKKIAFVVVFIIIIFIIGENIKNNTTSITEYEKTQIILNNENISEGLENDILIQNSKIYMSFNDVKNILDENLYIEEETGLIITTSNKKVATFSLESDTIQINGSNQTQKDILIEKDGTLYIAISELENVYDYEFNYISTTNIVTIDSLNKELIKAYVTKNVKIKEYTNSTIVDKVEKGNWLVYIGEENGKAKVRTQNGIIGYIKSSYLDNFITERENLDEDTNTSNKEMLEYDVTEKDMATYEKRLQIANLILQEAILNDKMYVKIIYSGEENFEFERFKIEVTPILKECGITVEI